MEQNNDNNTFFQKISEKYSSLPIDYSQNDASENLGTSRPTIDKYITSNKKLFGTLFSWIRYHPSPPKKDSTEYTNSIPAELGVFFKLFLKKKKSKECAQQILDGNVPQEWEDSFCRDLYELSVNAEQEATASNAPQKDNQLYWTRLLYNNAAYKKSASVLLWEKEYTWRVKAFQRLAMQQPPDQQMELLKWFIGYLDSLVTLLLSPEKNTTPAKEPEGFMSTFPLEVMQKTRVKADGHLSTKNIATYKISNVDLNLSEYIANGTLDEVFRDTESMEKAFGTINANHATGLDTFKAVIRQEYLEKSVKIPPKTEFQILCEEIKKYSVSYTEAYTDDELKAEIKKRCSSYFATILQGNAALTGIFFYDKDDPVKKSGKRYYIEDYVLQQYNAFVLNNRWGITCMGIIASDHQFYATIHFGIIHDAASNPNFTTEEFAKKQILSFENNLRSIWPFSLSQYFDLLGSAISTEIIDTVSSILEEKCNAAFKEFSIPEKRTISKVDIRKAFDKYNELHGPYTDFNSFAGYRYEDFVLIQALFTCKLWETYQWVCDSALDRFKAFSTYVKENRE